MTGRTGLLAAVLTAIVAPITVSAQTPTRLADALTAMEATEYEQAIELLESLTAAPTTADSVRAEAYLRLGEARFAMGQTDSVQPHFEAAVRADPFVEPDTMRFNPSMVQIFATSRRITVSVGARPPADTVLDPASDRFPVDVAAGAAGQLRVTVRPAEGGGGLLADTTMRLNGRERMLLRPLAASDRGWPAGRYRFRATLDGPRGQTDSTSFVFEVTPQPVDTVAWLPPLDSADLLPEVEKGGPNTGSAIRGLILGAAVGILPSLIASSDLGGGLDSRALTVGASISIAGFVGMSVGRPLVPLPDNVAANTRQRGQRDERNRRVAADNARTRDLAPLRVTIVRLP